MVRMVDRPNEDEFISEIAAEPDCATSATRPGRTLAVIVAG